MSTSVKSARVLDCFHRHLSILCHGILTWGYWLCCDHFISPSNLSAGSAPPVAWTKWCVRRMRCCNGHFFTQRMKHWDPRSPGLRWRWFIKWQWIDPCKSRVWPMGHSVKMETKSKWSCWRCVKSYNPLPFTFTFTWFTFAGSTFLGGRGCRGLLSRTSPSNLHRPTLEERRLHGDMALPWLSVPIKLQGPAWVQGASVIDKCQDWDKGIIRSGVF